MKEKIREQADPKKMEWGDKKREKWKEFNVS
jgi:hypothetical protein